MKRNIIRQIYLYAVSIISLFIVVFSTGQLFNIALKTWVFKLADRPYGSCEYGDPNYSGPYPAKPVMTDDRGTTAPELTTEEKAEQKAKCEKNLAEQRSADKQRELVSALSMLIVGIPVFIFHFKIVQRERDEDKASGEQEKKA